MSFGYQTNASTIGMNVTTETGIDNWRVDVASSTTKLTLAIDGPGTVGIQPSPAIYTCGTPVTLTAQPNGCPDIFNGWTGDVVDLTSPLQVVMNTNVSLTAHFGPGAVVLPDGAFAASDWSTTVIEGAGNVNGTHEATGGNPDEFRRLVLDWGPGFLRVAHMRDGALVSMAPAGGISAIDFSYDITSFSANQTRYGLVIHQGSDWYVHNPDVATALMPWTHFDHPGVVASSFTWVAGANPGSFPNFSAAGAPLEIGYQTSSTTSTPNTITDTGIDNWRVRVVGVCGIPAGVDRPDVADAIAMSARIHPNPFRSGVHIDLVLPVAGRVEARVLDVAGRLIRKVASGPREAGRHAIAWDGRDGRGHLVPSGVYLIQIISGGRALTGRVVHVE